MNRKHNFSAVITWGGKDGGGTTGYTAYSRNHTISGKGKQDIPASSDPAFRGDGTRYNPEELLVASLASCHMLWYLHLCADAGVVVVNYEDCAAGILMEEPNGIGKFSEVVLNPVVTIKDPSMQQMAMQLHHKAGKMCFIANSCNFPVHHRPIIKTQGNN